MPVVGLRVQAYQSLALAIKAEDEGRSSDAYELTRKATELLQDAMSVEALRRGASAATSGRRSPNPGVLRFRF